jgi:CBS domain-containing protein
MQKLIRDIMIKKVITINPFKSVDYAILKMQRYKVGGLPVVNNYKLVGIITSRDLRYHNPNRLVCDAMTKEVIAGTEDMSILEVLILMKENNVERLPILGYKRDRLVGIITKRDILSKMNDKEFSLVKQMIEESEDKILNPLSVINSAIRLLESKKGLESQDDKREYFKKIHRSIERISKEVKMLKNF